MNQISRGNPIRVLDHVYVVSSLPVCGKKLRAHKIVGGEATDANEYPWQVALVEKGKTKPFCGGSLISSKHVLSAGHCFQ